MLFRSKVKLDKIYEHSKFKLFGHNDYVIVTEERDIPLSDSFASIQLLNKDSIKKHSQKWNYMHIGLVQVGAKPLTKEGLDTSLLLILRDARLLKYDESILGAVETSLCSGPIHFDSRPGLTVSLKDKNILKSLTLQIKTHNYSIAEGSIPIALIYRIYYKVLNSAFGSKAFKLNSNRETLLLQTDISRANTTIPRTIPWNQITLPDQWELENRVPQPIIQNTDPTIVIQHPEGRVTIQFARRSVDIPRRSCDIRSIPSWHSTSSRKSVDIPNIPFNNPEEASASAPPLPNISGIDNRSGIFRPVYQHTPEFPNPTPSEMEDPEINVLEINFEPDQIILNKEFNYLNNKNIREWFFANF